MLSGIERFLGQHEHTVAALEAFSTFAAVMTSLGISLLSQRANRTKITIDVSINVISHSSLEGKSLPRYIVARITNKGMLPASIPLTFFNWRLPCRKGFWFLMPWDERQHDPWIAKKQYPVEILPRQSQVFFLSDMDSFREQMTKIFTSLTGLNRWLSRFLYAYAYTADETVFRVRLGSSLRQEIAAIRRRAYGEVVPFAP